MCFCVQLLLEQQEVLCPDPSDPLKQLLKDLGSVPKLQELIGTTTSAAGITSNAAGTSNTAGITSTAGTSNTAGMTNTAGITSMAGATNTAGITNTVGTTLLLFLFVPLLLTC